MAAAHQKKGNFEMQENIVSFDLKVTKRDEEAHELFITGKDMDFVINAIKKDNFSIIYEGGQNWIIIDLIEE